MDPQDDTMRTRYLDRLLADEEAGRLQPLAEYEQEFSSIAAFVREEYEAVLLRAEPTQDAAARYRPIEVIARGGMGQVTLALDTLLERRVALKSLRGPWHDARSIERLRREARVLGRLDHPAICRILDVIEVDGAITLVLPFHEGETLADRLHRARQGRQGGSPDPATTQNWQGLSAPLQFLAKVADGVQAAHQAGVIHRDLKPGNLIVGPEDLPMVLDFGLALVVGEESQRLTMTGEQVGTPYYMAPEQIEGRDCDARTDVHALGLVLYEMLTLERPFAAASREATFRLIQNGTIVPPRKRNPAIPRDLEAVCLRACERNPVHRYDTAGEFAAELRRILQLQPTLARPASGVRRMVQTVRRHPVRVAAAVMSAVVAGLALMLWADHNERERERTQLADRLRDAVAVELATLEVDEKDRSSSLTHKVWVAGERPDILSPRGDLVTPPEVIRLAAASPAKRLVTLRSDDLGRPWTQECEPGTTTIPVPAEVAAAMTPDRKYRLYLTEISTSPPTTTGPGAAMEPDAVFTILRPRTSRSPQDLQELAQARDCLRDRRPEAALQVLGTVDPAALDGDWLRLLHSTLRLRCMLALGIHGPEWEQQEQVQLRYAEPGRLERLPTLVERAHGWRVGGDWSESMAAVGELEHLFPLDSPFGLWTRISVARIRLTTFFDPERALHLISAVVATARSMPPWDEQTRASIVVTHVGPVQPWRQHAGTQPDTLAQALHLRGFVLNQLQRYGEAREDLEQALRLFNKTECSHRVANCHQELAEAMLMLDEPDWEAQHANQARDGFLQGWGVASATDIQPDATGVVSIERSKATAHRRAGRYQEAEAGYREFLVHWTKSEDPLTVPRANLANLDYHLTAIWLAECLLLQENQDKWAEGRRWLERLELDKQQFRLQHTGFLLRLTLVRAIAMWREGRGKAAIADMESAMEDPDVQGYRHDLQDMGNLKQRIK